jgi:hypothetical protein
VLFEQFPWWERGHVPHRLPLLFVGAVFGVAFRRRELVDGLTREPAVLLAACLLVPVSIACDRIEFPISLAAGLGVVAAGMLVSTAGGRWAVARPASAGLAALGSVAYELFLCHQYLLLSVGPTLLTPRLAEWFPRVQPFGRDLMAACLMLAAAVWVAYAVRWVVARAESRRTWRPTLAVVAATSAALVTVAAVVPAGLPRNRPRTFQIAVEPPADAGPAGAVPAGGMSASAVPAAGAEPVVYFGHAWAGELVFLEHDGNGRARLGIEQRGQPVVRSDWLPLAEVVGRPIEVGIDASRGVRPGRRVVAGVAPPAPQVPNAKPVVGRNDVGFASRPAGGAVADQPGGADHRPGETVVQAALLHL